ncbi:MAG: hypothetical protein LBE24_04150 [Methylobacillus sp.]|nr:hypothetical protein [Methylobacillus sp.]
MGDYFSFIKEWAGMGFLMPALFIFALIGTGIYIGKIYNHGRLGIVLGFALFIIPVFGILGILKRLENRNK